MALFVSLATLPSREAQVRSTVACLLAQTHPPDRIFVNVCPYYQRLDRYLPKDFLADLLAHPKIRIQESQDEGPANKFLRVPELTRDPRDTVILCDDDILYFHDALKHLCAFLEHQSDSAVGFLGRALTPSRRFNDSQRLIDHRLPLMETLAVPVDILMAVGMVALKANALPADLKDQWGQASTSCKSIRFTDDIFLNAVLSRQGIRRLVIPGWYRCRRMPIPDELWSLNRDGCNNDASLRYFRQDFSLLSHSVARRAALRAMSGLAYLLAMGTKIFFLFRWSQRNA